MSTVGEAIHNHHQELANTLHGYVSTLGASTPISDARALVAFLQDDLLPHAVGEEAYLYPAVDPLVKEYGRATATMMVDHEYVKRYIVQIEAAVKQLASAAPEARAAQQSALQQLCLQLEAVLLVHLDKEERVYLPLFEAHLSPEVQQRILDGMHEG
jgi:hemerythrin-like domain-containing protein